MFDKLRLPTTALWLLLPLEGLGVLAILGYATLHFTTFIAGSLAVFSWLGLVAGIAVYTALAYGVVRVIRAGLETVAAFGHALAEIQGKIIANRASSARVELLHVGNDVIIFKEAGKISIHPIDVREQKLIESSVRRIQEEQTPAIAEYEEHEGLAAPVQTFRQLLEAGVIQSALKQGKMLLGYVNGTLRYGSWLDLYSCGIGGVSGSGKTTTVRFLLFQAILAGAKLVMIDPHIGEPEESLAAQFKAFKNIHMLPPCSEAEKEVEKRVRWLMKEYLRRKAKGIKGPPLVFVLDEFNAIIRRLPDGLRKELADLLLTISQEGRKFGMFAMIIGQRWSEQDLGGKNYGAAIRSSLASTLAHRFTDEDQARKLVGGKNGPRCLELEKGHYLFRDTEGGLIEMITPYTVESDGEIIQDLLDEMIPETAVKAPEYTHAMESVALADAGTEPLQIASFSLELTPETTLESTKLAKLARQVVMLQAEGLQKADIMRRVWGVNPGGSEDYKRAVVEYQSIMQYVAEKMGA